MDFKQVEIEFMLHDLENSVHSQAHLEENRKHFSAQCLKIFNLLMAGKELTVLSAITEYGISSLPRRLADLILNGVKITDKWVKPTEGAKYKVWFMTEDDKKANRKLTVI